MNFGRNLWRLGAAWLAAGAIAAAQPAGLPSPFPVASTTATGSEGHARWDALAEVSAAAPGQPFWAAVRVKLDPGWHTYWTNSGDSGIPTQITWDLPPGWKAGGVQWPAPEHQLLSTVMNYVYENTAVFLVQITPPADLPPGTTVTLKAKVHWMVCDASTCLPPTDQTIELPLNTAVTAQVNDSDKAIIDQARAALPQPATAYDVSAWRQGDSLYLGLVSKTGADAAKELSEVYFFSSDGQTKPAAPQILHRTDHGWVLEMERTPTAPPDAKTLPGILTLAGSPALTVSPALATAPPAAFAEVNFAPAANASGGLLGILLFAFLGGLILNIMPCVFPVLAIKALGVAKQAGADRRSVVLSGLAYTAGVVISMWVLTGILMALRAGGAQLGWGFQLQQPGFVLGLAVFFLLFALSLSGVFEIGGSLIGLGTNLTAKQGAGGSFFQGVLAVVVATPCTAPLLAPALGAAFTLPAWQALVVFTCVALGLSLPFLLLSLFPGLATKLPRPGAWMETFKQFMAFPLYGTVGFLLYVLNGQVPEERFLVILLALPLVGMAAWFYGRFATPAASPTRRRVGQLGGLVLLLLALAAAYWPVKHLDWEKWTPNRVEELQIENRPIFVDFTAHWCTVCQVNKYLVFQSTDRVNQAFKDKNVAMLQGDWTNYDANITAELARHGQAGVPLDLLYLPGKTEPIVLPSPLTPDMVLDALNGKTAATN